MKVIENHHGRAFLQQKFSGLVQVQEPGARPPREERRRRKREADKQAKKARKGGR